MARLFTYCLRIDDGAAPNPFWGVCSLVICKPAIRRTAHEGDWVVGTGSKNVRGQDFARKVVYAMRVSRVLSMRDYEVFVRKELPNKVPDWRHRDGRRRGLDIKPNTVVWEPQYPFPEGEAGACACSHLEEAEADEAVAGCAE